MVDYQSLTAGGELAVSGPGVDNTDGGGPTSPLFK